MVRVLESGSSGPGLGPGWGHCVVFLGKTFNFHRASLHPGTTYYVGGRNSRTVWGNNYSVNNSFYWAS